MYHLNLQSNARESWNKSEKVYGNKGRIIKHRSLAGYSCSRVKRKKKPNSLGVLGVGPSLLEACGRAIVNRALEQW